MIRRYAALIAALLLGAVPALAQTGQPFPPTSATIGSTVVPLGAATTTISGLALTSPTFNTKTTTSTGADNTVTVCQDPSATTYNMLSLNGDCSNTATQGLMAGATADPALYLANKTSGTLSYRVNGALVWTVDSAGKQTVGTIGDVQLQNSKVSTAGLNRTDTTFATVTGLSMTLTAGKSYNCRGHLTVTAAPAAGGIKVTLATTDTLTVTSISMTALNMNGTTVNARTTTAVGLGTAIGGATATATDIDIDAGIVVNAAGTLVVQAAQNAASGTTTVGPNSTFSCDRVS